MVTWRQHFSPAGDKLGGSNGRGFSDHLTKHSLRLAVQREDASLL